jgi:DNA-binding MarR family transcriptional regulator
VTATRGEAANVLGALALAIADQFEQASAIDAGTPTRGDSGAAALSALDQFLDGPSVSRVRDVLGLTHSGAVRLLDRLASSGLIAREPGPDGRTRSVRLTPRGRRTARRAAERRGEYLGGVLEGLTAAEVTELHRLLSRVMDRVVDHKDGGAWICRRCDLGACGRAQGRCPAANAARRKYGIAANAARA